MTNRQYPTVSANETLRLPWREALRRLRYVLALENAATRPSSVAAIERIRVEEGEGERPSLSTVLRWRRLYLRAGRQVAALVPFHLASEPARATRGKRFGSDRRPGHPVELVESEPRRRPVPVTNHATTTRSLHRIAPLDQAIAGDRGVGLVMLDCFFASGERAYSEPAAGGAHILRSADGRFIVLDAQEVDRAWVAGVFAVGRPGATRTWTGSSGATRADRVPAPLLRIMDDCAAVHLSRDTATLAQCYDLLISRLVAENGRRTTAGLVPLTRPSMRTFARHLAKLRSRHGLEVLAGTSRKRPRVRGHSALD